TRFGQNIQDHFDKYTKEVVSKDTEFNYQKEEKLFNQIIDYLCKSNDNIFKMSRRNFSTSVFDSIMLVIAENLDHFYKNDIKYLEKKIPLLINDPKFKQNAGSASSSQTKINAKIKIAKKMFEID
ncbi:hypothetical protein QUF90_26405, partial [Desulfococcaceae bacterium HSG9]|nr:hypothetical protein [Desulfococcaceae bacterium HSG9]